MRRDLVPTIFLDISRLVFRRYRGLLPTGIDRVGLAYIEKYGEQARAVLSAGGFTVILSTPESRRVFDWLLAPEMDRRGLVRLVARAIFRAGRTPDETGVLLHTSHHGMEFARYYRTMKRRNIRTVFMVHDLIPMTHAEYCRPGVDAAHRKRIHAMLRRADGVIANSADTLGVLATEARRAGLDMPPNVVAHLAPGRAPRISAPRLVESPYFVMLGTIEPRKNHWFILHVWRRLVERHGDATPRLVIIGRRGWECENVVDMLERCTPLRDAVIEESACSDERLVTWLHHAQALLMPSFVEGFGMPVVEALAMRVPVIASALGVFKEFAGDMPDYLDPLDGPGWLARIEAYAHPDSAQRAARLQKIGAFQAPTWPAHFARVDALLDVLR